MVQGDENFRMIHELKITALVDNTSGAYDLLGEWGLSLWIEADNHRVLFDTGKGRTLTSNARLLGIDLKDAGALVVSHGHFDHTGGIAEALASGFRGKVYAHPWVLMRRYERREKPPHREVGMPARSLEALRSRNEDFIGSSGPAEIAPGLIVTGAIPRQTDFEDTGGLFFLDEACTQPDPLVDDQALLIRTQQGLVVIVGCCHAGVVNTLDYAAALTGDCRIRAVVGGLHLRHASKQRLKGTVDYMKRIGVRTISACHCTGFDAVVYLQNHLDAEMLTLGAGLSLRFTE